MSLQWVATAAVAGPSALSVWIIGGLIMFLPLSVCTVFLAARHPDHGGLYVWTRLAFGRFAGFLTGWTYWTANLPYFAGMLYFAAGCALWTRGDAASAAQASPAWFISFSVAALALATWVNVRGLRIGKWLNNVGAWARFVTVLLLFAVAAWAWRRFGSATPITTAALKPGFSLNDLMFWSAIAFAFSGPESASLMGGEIRDPRRTVPRALAIAAPLVLIMYMGGTLAVLIAMPYQETSALYGVVQAFGNAGTRLGLTWLAPLAAILTVITCLGSASAWLGSVARLPFLAGIDRYLPARFGRLHPRYGSPATALIAQSVIAMVLAVMGQAGTTVKGAYQVLVDLMVIMEMLPYAILFAAAIRLAWGPAVAGDLRLPGGRATLIVCAVIGLIATLGAIVLSCVPAASEPNKVLAVVKVVGMTLLLLGAGVAVYVSGQRRALTAAAAVEAAAAASAA